MITYQMRTIAVRISQGASQMLPADRYVHATVLSKIHVEVPVSQCRTRVNEREAVVEQDGNHCPLIIFGIQTNPPCWRSSA
jgi:hypothetical protein